MIRTMLLAWFFSPYFLVIAFIGIFYVLPYIRLSELRHIPAPFPAAFTDLWLLFHTRTGKRSLAVHDAHKKYGKLVRIQPNHVSVADIDAIQIIYGHANGLLKTDYYDAFIFIRPSLFSTRDRAEHTRKRKAMAPTFSAKSLGQFEQFIQANLRHFLQQLTQLSELQGSSNSGYASIDALNWFSYLAFDIIGDFVFSAPFGMLPRGQDVAEMKKSPDAPPSYVPAVRVRNRRGELSATLACIPAILPFAKYLPFRVFREGLEAMDSMAGIAIARVAERLRPEVMANNKRVDFLSHLIEGCDENGAKFGREEITAEALTQISAGSDTTSNTLCMILYWVLKTPGVTEKLQEVLDEAIPTHIDVPSFAMAKDIPYLQWVIFETLRLHTTLALGLPRVIPQHAPPITIEGHVFKPGTVFSVPAYTMHISQEIWGPDAEEFVPTRWDPARLTASQKEAFIPFGYGPRACIGRNVAEMELQCAAAMVFKNFEFRLEQDGSMEIFEELLRKPLGLAVGVRRRQPEV